MKKLFAIVLMLGMLLSLTDCGTINEAEVAVPWSGENNVALVPNSLINAMDRAMYIENIAYSHYAAAGDQAKQTKQAEDARNAGCAALAVELVDVTAAPAMIELAKAKNVPVVFFNCAVTEDVIAAYDKCAAVVTDEATLPTTYGELIGEYIYASKTIDRNGDGVVSYCAVGEVAELVTAAEKAMLAKAESVEEKEEATGAVKGLTAVEGADMASVLTSNNDENGNMIELVISSSDEDALVVLEALQSIDYNTNRLKTHCIPVFTVGADADASAFTDTSALTEEERAQLIYNVMNIVDAGQLTGIVLEDYDGIAVAAAAAIAGYINGEPVEKTLQAIPYTIYSAE